MKRSRFSKRNHAVDFNSAGVYGLENNGQANPVVAETAGLSVIPEKFADDETAPLTDNAENAAKNYRLANARQISPADVAAPITANGQSFLDKPVDILLDTLNPQTKSRKNPNGKDFENSGTNFGNYEVYQDSHETFAKELAGAALHSLLLKPYEPSHEPVNIQNDYNAGTTVNYLQDETVSQAETARQAALSKPTESSQQISSPQQTASPEKEFTGNSLPLTLSEKQSPATAVQLAILEDQALNEVAVYPKQELSENRISHHHHLLPQGVEIYRNGDDSAIDLEAVLNRNFGNNGMDNAAVGTSGNTDTLHNAQNNMDYPREYLSAKSSQAGHTEILFASAPSDLAQSIVNLAPLEGLSVPPVADEQRSVSATDSDTSSANDPTKDSVDFLSKLFASGSADVADALAAIPENNRGDINFPTASTDGEVNIPLATATAEGAKSAANSAKLESAPVSVTASDNSNKQADNTESISQVTAPVHGDTAKQATFTTSLPASQRQQAGQTAQPVQETATQLPPVRIERVFEQLEDDLLIFENNNSATVFDLQISGQTWKTAIFNVLAQFKKFVQIPGAQKFNPHEYADLNKAARAEILRKRRKNIFTSWVTLVALCHLAALILWAIFPGSFFNIYKTQISGYVFQLAWRFGVVVSLPTLLCWRKYHIQAYEPAAFLYKAPFKIPQFIIAVIAGFGMALLANAANRILVINFYSYFDRAVSETAFLLPTASNAQSWFLILLIGCLITAVSESLFLQGFFMGSLLAGGRSIRALLLQGLLAPVFYAGEYDFVSVFIFFICLGKLRQSYDNLFSVIAANLTCKISLLLLRLYLPFLSNRALFSPNAKYAMLLVDVLLLLIVSFVLHLLFKTLSKEYPYSEIKRFSDLQGQVKDGATPAEGATASVATGKKEQAWIKFLKLCYYRWLEHNEISWKNLISRKLLIAYLIIWISYLVATRI